MSCAKSGEVPQEIDDMVGIIGDLLELVGHAQHQGIGVAIYRREIVI
jgi:hypothetical protein